MCVVLQAKHGSLLLGQQNQDADVLEAKRNQPDECSRAAGCTDTAFTGQDQRFERSGMTVCKEQVHKSEAQA